MTDYVEEAAAKAVELAEELATPTTGTMTRLQVIAAAHLTYMAGLLRGGAASAEPTSVTTSADEMSSEAWATTRGIIANERNARLQADRLRKEALDLIGEEQRKRREVAEHRDRYLRERNELLAAAEFVTSLSRDDAAMPRALDRLQRLIDRIRGED